MPLTHLPDWEERAIRYLCEESDLSEARRVRQELFGEDAYDFEEEAEIDYDYAEEIEAELERIALELEAEENDYV